MTRVAFYARVSTDDGRQEVGNQIAELRQFAETQGWEIVHEYIDHESGSKADRAEFLRMFADAAQRRFDVVLFWALDRFSREGVFETHVYLKRLDEAGVRFRSFTEPYLDSCGMFRDAVISILAVIAKQERVRRRERVIAGLHHARRNGTRSGNPIGRPRKVFRRDTVLELRAAGESWRQIARAVGAGVTTVRRAAGNGGAPNTEGGSQ